MISIVFVVAGVLVLLLAEEPPTAHLAILAIAIGVILGSGEIAMRILP